MQLKREFVRIRLKKNDLVYFKNENMQWLPTSWMCREDLAYAMLTGLPADSYDALTMFLANLDKDRFTSNEIKKALLEWNTTEGCQRTRSKISQSQKSLLITLIKVTPNRIHENLVYRINASNVENQDILQDNAEVRYRIQKIIKKHKKGFSNFVNDSLQCRSEWCLVR